MTFTFHNSPKLYNQHTLTRCLQFSVKSFTMFSALWVQVTLFVCYAPYYRRSSRTLFLYRQLFACHVVGSRPWKEKFASNDNDERSPSKMTTNMVKKRVRERSKLQPYPLGLSLKKWKGLA